MDDEPSPVPIRRAGRCKMNTESKQMEIEGLLSGSGSDEDFDLNAMKTGFANIEEPKITVRKRIRTKKELVVPVETKINVNEEFSSKLFNWWSTLDWSCKQLDRESASDNKRTSENNEKLSSVDEDYTSEFPAIICSLKFNCKTPDSLPKESFTKFITRFFRDWCTELRKFNENRPNELNKIRKLRNLCICELLLILFYCGLGSIAFKYCEGAFESFYKCGVKRVKRDFIEELWRGSHYMREDEWKSKARKKLMEFENQLQDAFEAGITTYSGLKSWSFINGIIYSLTVITTIGYGHIAPVTTTGRLFTIGYAFFGVPLFLILLADYGKMLTRVIKYIWAFVRSVYNAGPCGGMTNVRSSFDVMGTNMEKRDDSLSIDEEFDLPVTLALSVELIYIMIGALVFFIWEDWTFFQSFYFIFISMATIGFGDFVPQNQMYMMASIVYFIFGLSLTSMCINVVREKLANSFTHASAKLGETIGLQIGETGGNQTRK